MSPRVLLLLALAGRCLLLESRRLHSRCWLRLRPFCVTLALVCVVYFYRLDAAGVLGPDEPRYASIGREMARSGDWITPRLWGQPWFEKPALLYWMTGAAFRLGLGPDIAPRLPVALFSVAFLIFFWWRLRREFGDSVAWTLMRYLPPTPGINFLDRTTIGCGVVRGGPYRYSGVSLEQKPECDAWPERWAQRIGYDRPDVVLMVIGRWETVDRKWNGNWAHIGQPDFDKYLEGELRHALDILGSHVLDAVHNSQEQLPVAAGPAVLARHGDVVAGGKLLDDFDVGREARPGKCPFKKIVAEKRILRHAIAQGRLEGVHIIDALARVAALPKEVLVDFGHGKSIGVCASAARIEAVEQRGILARREYGADARLQDAIAPYHPLPCAVEPRLDGAEAVGRLG